jgi:hypothetical protein
MPQTTSQRAILVQCPACYSLHPQDYWGSCDDRQNSYASAEEYAARHPEAKQTVEVLEFV